MLIPAECSARFLGRLLVEEARPLLLRRVRMSQELARLAGRDQLDFLTPAHALIMVRSLTKTVLHRRWNSKKDARVALEAWFCRLMLTDIKQEDDDKPSNAKGGNREGAQGFMGITSPRADDSSGSNDGAAGAGGGGGGAASAAATTTAEPKEEKMMRVDVGMALLRGVVRRPAVSERVEHGPEDPHSRLLHRGVELHV